jgi:hypothetical protein
MGLMGSLGLNLHLIAESRLYMLNEEKSSKGKDEQIGLKR